MSNLGWETVRRVLAIRLDGMGDVLMTTPALRAIRESGALVTLLASRAGAHVAAHIPEIDDVILYESPWMKATPFREDVAADREMVSRLRDEQFDAAVIFTAFSQSALPGAMLAYLAGIPRRLAHCRENPYQLLTDWVKDPEPDQLIRHEVSRQLALIESVGWRTDETHLSFAVPPRAVAAAAALFDRAGIDRCRPAVVLHPGATAPSRRYPPQQFGAVLRGLVDAGLQVALTGSAEEAGTARDVVWHAGVDVPSLAGESDVATLAAVIALGDQLISGNTGAVHLAAAVGTPVVDLYALTNPQHTPWQVPHRMLFEDVPCKFCFKSICPTGTHDCLAGIPPERVIDASRSLLAETREAPAIPAAAGGSQ